MEIVSWNLQFWQRILNKNNNNKGIYYSTEEIETWKIFIRSLIESDYDFILLQEINPYVIYNEKYRCDELNIHNFKVINKNIFYNEFFKTLKRQKLVPDRDHFWGNAIIAKDNYFLKEIHSYDNNKKHIGLTFRSYETLMCYDFQVDAEKSITLINFYNKGNNWDYEYEEAFFEEISSVVKKIDDRNIIIFAGDFNTNQITREKIEMIGTGFIEKTKSIDNTMVEVKGVKPFHNDCIFVNKKYAELVRIEKIPNNEKAESIY